MAVAQKFLFDQSFDGPSAGPRAKSRAPIAPAQPTFTETELAAAREEGRARGAADAVATQDLQLGAALDAIAERMAMLLADKAQTERESERQVIETTRVIVAKLFPALVRRDGFAEIEALVTSSLRECIDEPRLVLRVADALFTDAQNRIAPLAARTGHEGKLVILADETLAGADCRVEWADGGVERDMTRTMRTIEATMARALESLSTTDGPSRQGAGGANEETVDG